MKILAFEFSSPQRSVAVLNAEGGLRSASSEVIESPVQGMKPVGMIEQALHEAQLEREQIECVAVGLGPGSYTGIRAAIALAQGWQLARAVRLVGVGSAECLAAQAHANGLRGRVTVAIDAQRGELYFAEYELDTANWRETVPLQLGAIADVQRRADAAPVLGPEVTRWFASGRTMFPRAATVAQLALARPAGIAAEELEPIYLREMQFIKAPPPRILPPG
jgi:tRNA threonylcarbamoyl adenosine modification protein YeaZ